MDWRLLALLSSLVACGTSDGGMPDARTPSGPPEQDAGDRDDADDAPSARDLDPTEPDATDTAPPPWTVSVEPAAPRWNEDLRCVVGALPAGSDAQITWSREATPWTGPTTTTDIPHDTIPHLSQAGMERWACTATVDGATQTSDTVEVTPPYAMSWLPPGTFQSLRSYLFNDQPFTLTRGFLLGKTEIPASEWVARMGHEPVSPGPAYPPVHGLQPAAGLTQSEAFYFANLVSIEDGLEPCYTCTGSPPDVHCDRPPQADVYGCEGYRLPTWTEFDYAYHEAGRHQDPIPTGGTFEVPPNVDPDNPEGEWDSVVIGGPVAGTSTADQCATGPSVGGYPIAVGSLTPNAYDLYDLCGNVSEWMSDPAPPSRSKHATPTDPISYNDDPSRDRSLAAGADARTDNPSYYHRHLLGSLHGTDSRSYHGFRLARTWPTREDIP